LWKSFDIFQDYKHRLKARFIPIAYLFGQLHPETSGIGISESLEWYDSSFAIQGVDELGKAAAALKVCSMIYIVPLSVVF
jgi:hypothetical protein